jgi:hypothetical protein
MLAPIKEIIIDHYPYYIEPLFLLIFIPYILIIKILYSTSDC